MLEGAERRTSMCQAYYCTFYIRERYIVSVSSNFLTQISCGIKTKCRKTRAMQRASATVDSLALRQCDTSVVLNAHLLKLLFLARYTFRSIYQSSMCDSQSASSCGLASWMRSQQCDTSMIPDTHLLKLLFLARYTHRSIYLPSYQSALFCRLASWMRE